jgi:hypothetical protein
MNSLENPLILSESQQLQLKQAIEVYERTMEQDPEDYKGLRQLREFIISLNPYHQFLIDPFACISLPEVYTNITHRHIQALKRAIGEGTTEETLPPLEISTLSLKTFQQVDINKPVDNTKKLKPSEKLRALLNSKR